MPADHILSYAEDLSGGGVERALLRLAGGWAAAGRRVTLVLGSAAGPLAAELPSGVAVIDLRSPSMRALTLALPGQVRRLAPDVLFCPGNYYTIAAAWTRARLGPSCPPIVAKMSNAARRGDHGPLADWGHRVWLRSHRRFLDALVAMTVATAAEAEHATGMTGRVSVIPNPPAPAGHGQILPDLPPMPFILGVGRLVRQKRWDRLIAVLPELPEAAVVIAGEGPERARLVARASALGVANRLHLVGHVADPLSPMRRATVLALPSDFEGVPGVLIEALSVGTPVVATDSSPSVGEIVASPELGSIVPRGDQPALLQALRDRLRPGAPRPAPRPLPGADSADRYLQLFDRLVSDRADN